MCCAFHIFISKQLYSCTAYLNKTFKQCFYHKSHKPGIKCEVIYGDDTGTAVNTLQYVYHTPRSLSAEIPPLLAKQKVTCTSGTIHEIENIVNILPKCGDFPANPLEENVKEHWNLP